MTPEQRQQLRQSIIENLARQPAVAFPADAIRRRIERSRDVDGAVGMGDVLDALAFLEGYGFAKRVRRPLSGLQDWQITSEGVAYWESNP
ncbi:MAG: hypothetical protein IJS32_06830 [Kiritimatiellae bacterium]|nr:hypothetical protein [Kiritimatiellia bacterium]